MPKNPTVYPRSLPPGLALYILLRERKKKMAENFVFGEFPKKVRVGLRRGQGAAKAP
jgi:hypothetical protein